MWQPLNNCISWRSPFKFIWQPLLYFIWRSPHNATIWQQPYDFNDCRNLILYGGRNIMQLYRIMYLTIVTYWLISFNVFYSPVHMRWFTHGVYIIHICIICTRVYFWACERNCIYVKVNLHMCKYTPPCKYTPAQTRCIFAYTYMYFIHICIFGHVNAQQIYTRMQM